MFNHVSRFLRHAAFQANNNLSASISAFTAPLQSIKTSTSLFQRLYSSVAIENSSESLEDVKNRVMALKHQYRSDEAMICASYRKVVDTVNFQYKVAQAKLNNEELERLSWYLLEGLYENIVDSNFCQPRSHHEILNKAIRLAKSPASINEDTITSPSEINSNKKL